MTTIDEQKTKAREHQREVINTMIDLLDSLGNNKQMQIDAIMAAAAAMGIILYPKTTPTPRGSYRPGPKRRYS